MQRAKSRPHGGRPRIGKEVLDLRTRFKPGETAAWQWVAAVIAYATDAGRPLSHHRRVPVSALRPVFDEITKDSYSLQTGRGYAEQGASVDGAGAPYGQG